MGIASPEKIQSIKKLLLPLGVVGLGAATLYRSYPTAAEQVRRTEALRQYRREDPSTPMPNLTVHASYGKFASEKRAENPPPSFGTRVQEGIGKGVGQGMSMPLGDLLIRTPLSNLGDFLKKRLFTGPSQQKAFHSSLEDENIGQFHKENPGMLESAHRSLTMFAPEASTDPNLVKNYLNQVMMTRGNVDIATLKLLAETEKALQQTRETPRR